MKDLKKYSSSILIYMLMAYTFLACISFEHVIFQVLLYTIIISAPLILDDTKTLSLYLYSACFMACLGSTSGFLIALNISFLVLELKKICIAIKTKENLQEIKKIFMVWLGLLLTLTIYSLIYNNFHIYRMGMFLDFVQCCVIYFLVRKTIDIKIVVLHLFAGITISFVIAVLFQFCNIYSPFIAGSLDIRFGAFFNNINTLAVYCSLCAACFISLILNNKLDFKRYFYFPPIVTMIGLLSYSKAFILVNILLYLAWFALSFIKSNNKKHFIWYSLILIVVGTLILISAKDYISTILNRFTTGNFGSPVGNLTTGRAEIWKQYINKWLASPITFLFGNGYTSQKIGTNQYEHSIYIAFLNQFGIIGSIIIIGTLIWTMRKGGKLSRSIASYIVIGFLLVNGISSNLSGVLCTCLPWLLSFYFITQDVGQYQKRDKSRNNLKPREK